VNIVNTDQDARETGTPGRYNHAVTRFRILIEQES